jgi:hypothetical protein
VNGVSCPATPSLLHAAPICHGCNTDLAIAAHAFNSFGTNEALHKQWFIRASRPRRVVSRSATVPLRLDSIKSRSGGNTRKLALRSKYRWRRHPNVRIREGLRAKRSACRTISRRWGTLPRQVQSKALRRTEDPKSALHGSLARHGPGRAATPPRNCRPADLEARLRSDRGLCVLERSGPS